MGYLIFIMPALLLSIYAQYKVSIHLRNIQSCALPGGLPGLR